MIKIDLLQFKNLTNILYHLILRHGYQYKFIYGVPRGGIPVAMELSHLTGIPLIEDINIQGISCRDILIVDDIIDTGTTRNKFMEYDFACLHIKAYVKNHGLVLYTQIVDEWVSYWWEEADNNSTIEENITRILQLIGEDPTRRGLIADLNDPNSLSTPQRVARMYQDFFCGYDSQRKPRVTVVPNGEDGVVYNEMLRDSGYFASFCEHHMLPFFGEYYYGYIPDKKIMGASKIGRLVDYYCGRLQIAERLVNQIVAEIDDIIKPVGQVLVMNARHFCKEIRGLKKWNSPYEAIAVRGCFSENINGCKDEFMARIPRSR